MSEQEVVEAMKPPETEPRKRILIADDEESIRRFFGLFLGKAFDVVEAANGKEAWQKLDDPKEKFDLLITDKKMPEGDGLEVLQAMRKSPKEHLRNMPAIMISGDFTPQVKKQVEELDAQTIEKPILDLNTLVEMAKSAIKTSEAPSK